MSLEDKYKTVGGGGGGSFLKINDGETVKVRIVSDPVYFDNEYKGQLSARIAWVVWNHDEQKPQIWQTNGATYNSVKDLVADDEYGDPTEYDIKITRTGIEQQTRYSVRPGAKRYSLEDDQLEQCNAIDIIAKIDRSEYTHHVMWLEEHREDKEPEDPEESGYAKAKAKRDEIAGENEEQPLDGEPINLDDIPF